MSNITGSVQFSSVAQSCSTLCDPMNHSIPGLPVHYQHPEFTQTHVHWVDDAIQPFHLLSSPSPPAPQNLLKLMSIESMMPSSHLIFHPPWKVKVKSLSSVWLFETPWTVAYQAPPSMKFSRQEYWSGLPFPSPGDLPGPGMEPSSSTDALPSELPGKPNPP